MQQPAVYAAVAAPMVADLVALRQPEAVVMAYGVTSAGKTHTMQGTSEAPGLVPRALADVFERLAAGGGGAGGAGGARVTVSCYEVRRW